MTVGAGAYVSLDDHLVTKQNNMIRQLLEGRSNAVGTFSLTNNGSATSTGVTAPNCGPNSAVFITPCTAAANTARSTTYVLSTNVAAGGFTVTHAATTTASVSFWYVCLG